MNKRGQNWSIEVIVSLSIFVAIFITLMIVLMASQQQDEFLSVQSESKDLVERFSGSSSAGSPITFIENNEVNQEKLLDISNMDYDQLKKELGLSDDFCILLENGSGVFVAINETLGVGSEQILIDGVSCGTYYG